MIHFLIITFFVFCAAICVIGALYIVAIFEVEREQKRELEYQNENELNIDDLIN